MREKIKLSGVPETMLQTVYARAKESRRPRRRSTTQKAEELIERLDYDFSLADKDTAMRSGVIARTIVLDQLTKDWLASAPRRGGGQHRLRAGHPLLPDVGLRALV